MASLDLQGLGKRYGEFDAVREVNLQVADGEFLVLLGPSGCGKTTTLRMVAGFIEPTSGHVKLRSNDPFETPEIHFKYFEESDQPDDHDVESVVDGVELALEMYDRLRRRGLVAEVLEPAPGTDLKKFVRDTAWGHHASCTCPIGPKAQGGVLDSTLQVHGTSRLRVADASAFPRIPGFFIAAAIFMLAEKAADMLLATAHGMPASVGHTQPGGL